MPIGLCWRETCKCCEPVAEPVAEEPPAAAAGGNAGKECICEGCQQNCEGSGPLQPSTAAVIFLHFERISQKFLLVWHDKYP